MENLLVSLLKRADEGGYAIPHFNCADCWDMMAVIQAAIEEEAPIIVAAIPKVLDILPPEVFCGMGKGAGAFAKVPVVVHLDHSKEVSFCKKCVDAGFTSVMIDGSLEPLEDNIQMIQAVTAYAHQKNICVEGEIGKIKGRDYEGKYDGNDFLVQVDEAKELVEKSKPDLLAVGIGTAHGFYKETPKINFERLAEVNKAVDIPLVLHGGTGIPEADVHRAIREGINKVNVGTIIKYTNVATFHRLHTVKDFDLNTHTVDLAAPVIAAIKEEARRWIRVCMANGKA
jgi:ketose-bisphosphate aldolase